MKTHIVMILFASALLATAVLFTACSFGLEGIQQPASHFVGANETIKIVGFTRVEESKFCGLFYILNFNPHYGEMVSAAIGRAVAEKGGDLLVDYTTEISEVPVFGSAGGGLIKMCYVKVSGYVGKIEGQDGVLTSRKTYAVPDKPATITGYEAHKYVITADDGEVFSLTPAQLPQELRQESAAIGTKGKISCISMESSVFCRFIPLPAENP